jgi:predicted exporter
LWPTMMLGVLSSICGFASLLPSSFPGLAQLGLFSVSGLIAAAAVTRYVLPQLCGGRARMSDLAPLGVATAKLMSRVRVAPAILVALALACALVLFAWRGQLWNRDIAALSPVTAAAQRLDAQLRADLGAPDIGSLVVVSADSEQAALRLSEAMGARLEPLIERGVIAGYDSPARYLPSEALQASRRASLPAEGELQARVADVSTALSLQPKTLEPFVQQAAAARSAQPLTRVSLDGTSFALALDALLWPAGQQWHAILPLRPAVTGEYAGVIDLPRIREALGTNEQVLVLSIKQETDALYSGYLGEAIRLSTAGLAAIVVLLSVALRSLRRVARVILPLLLAVLVVVTSLALAGTHLTILHLVGMLLIVAVGSNYALFFDRRATDADREALPLTLASLLIANTCTVIGFGVLAFSSVPVLSALGTTVAPGTLLALWFSALIAPRDLWA